MSRRQYSTLWKNIAITVQVILTVTFVLAISLLGALVNKNVLNTSELWNADFLESGYYRDLFQQKTNDVIQFLHLRNKFETDGVYSPDKSVNILHYAKDGSVQNGGKVLILAKDEEGNYIYNEATPENMPEDVPSPPQGDDWKELASAENEKVQELIQVQLSNYRLGDLINWAKEGYEKTNGKIEESYLPTSGMGIEEALKQELITRVQAENLYNALEITLSTIGEEAKRYKKMLNELHTEESNLTYYYGENAKTIYSNMESVPEDILAYARTQGSYLYYDSGKLKFRTNVSGVEDYFYKSLDNQIARIGNMSSIVVAVDTSFVQEDVFAQAKREYNSLHPWILISIVSVVVSLFGWIIAFVYLTMVAGCTNKDTQIHLNLFDKMKTELFFAVFVMLMVGMISMTYSISQGEWGIPGMLIMIGTGAFIFDTVFLVFYLSMVRRVKAGVLWEYSLMHWIGKNTRRILHGGKRIAWLVVCYGGVHLLLLFFAYGSFAKKNVLAITGMILLIGADAVRYLRDRVGRQEIIKGIEKITEGDLKYKIPMENLHGGNQELAEAVNRIGEGLRRAVDESTKNERMKADLITNVSHDIKTPLTSIINYVNLLKMESIENQRVKDYIRILDDKSQRLRQLTEDLVEASRISSGNITLQMSEINFVELIYQTGGEFNEKFEAKDLTTITKLPKEAAIIMADGRRIWRVVENLYNNVAKYAMAHTRVYVTMEKKEKEVSFSVKNISEQALVVDSSELTERFIRGDEARTTEGSGLGLSIAKNLTILMGGRFEINVDGDVFLATITFPLVEDKKL